jgi:hypothetical protein
MDDRAEMFSRGLHALRSESTGWLVLLGLVTLALAFGLWAGAPGLQAASLMLAAWAIGAALTATYLRLQIHDEYGESALYRLISGIVPAAMAATLACWGGIVPGNDRLVHATFAVLATYAALMAGMVVGSCWLIGGGHSANHCHRRPRWTSPTRASPHEGGDGIGREGQAVRGGYWRETSASIP